MSKKSQADRLKAMVSKAQNVARPSDVNTASRENVKMQNRETVARKLVNIGTSVPQDVALWWTAQGKLKRRLVADVIREALIAEYGLPDGYTEADVYPERKRD